MGSAGSGALDTRAIEQRTQQLGRALLASAARVRPSPAERIQDWLLTRAVADERFRGRLLRYIDVLAALDFDDSGREAKRLAQEYFGDRFPDLPRPLRWLLRVARSEYIPAPLVGETANRGAALFARRFISPPTDEAIAATTAYLAEHGRLPSFDLLGEAVLSEVEADAYRARYHCLIERLSHDPAAGTRTADGVPALQLSLKLSSLTSHFTAVDAEGTIARVRPALEELADAARTAGVGIAVDMEQFAVRDLTWEIFRRTFGRGGRFGGWPDAAIVLQGYLRDAESTATTMIAFARERAVPVQVRLVKGAYWDYERITATANRWHAPVHTEKAATDAQFERLLGTLIDAGPAIHLAVASHNVRAHAVAEAIAEAAGLASRTIEHQTLFRTAEGTSRALVAAGWTARDYVPVGELLPGMAYLVRRVLENSSQAGFLLQSRSGASVEELLRPPPLRPPAPPAVGERDGPFVRAPSAPWYDVSFRRRIDAALASTRQRWGQRFALSAGGDPLPSDETVEVSSPSQAGGEPVGFVEFGGGAAVERAVAVARSGRAVWRERPAADRSSVLRRAATLLHERLAEFTAWVVHEGGRERVDAAAEVEEAMDYLNYYAAEAEQLFHSAGDRIVARGVVAVIPPWNFPLAIPCGMAAAALATGNSVILKPAEQTPLVAHRLVALLHEAGVPPDALICLPGRGVVAGAALVEHPGVAMVAFTGSRATGTSMHEAVAEVDLEDGGMKALVAEMGGKNPIIVFADADLDEAIEGILRSAFGHAGQKCSAASRVLVAAPIAQRLRDRLVDAARSLVVGAAGDPATQINPIIDAEARARLQLAATTARVECDLLLDRFGDDELEDHEARPTRGPLIVELPASRVASSRTASRELFGPILLLTTFADEAEAYRLANATDYALTAGIFSRSPRTIGRAVRAVAAGNIYVNRPTTGARVGVEPFGGMRMSGTGPKAGGTGYLWAYTKRTDAPPDGGAQRPLVAGASVAELPPLASRWADRLTERIETIERAAVLLAELGEAAAAALLACAQAARRELGAAQPTVQVPGQHTELRYDTPRGVGLVHASGPLAPWWLCATLLAGNAAIVVDSPALVPVVAALHAAGVSREALHHDTAQRDPSRLLALASHAQLDFVAASCGPSLARALYRALGPTVEGQRGLKALISTVDGPQPGEPGFVQRFAWPKLVAVRTLRHGADLAFDVGGDEF